MKPKWSPHAKILLADILHVIGMERSPEDAARWNLRIQEDSDRLEFFPHLGSRIPDECFMTIPDNADRLRQIFCGPYRIMYEPVEDEIHILSIRHSRMLVTAGDAIWN